MRLGRVCFDTGRCGEIGALTRLEGTHDLFAREVSTRYLEFEGPEHARMGAVMVAEIEWDGLRRG